VRINTGTWHYRLWKFTHLFERAVPEQTSLCGYVNRIILFTIPVSLFVAFAWSMVCLGLFLGNIVTILSGSGMLWPSEDTKADILRPFPNVKIGTRRVAMSTIVRSLWGLALLAVLGCIWPQKTSVGIMWVGGVVLAFVVLVLFIAAILDGFRRIGRWDGYRLFKEYLKAKKQGGFCPLVTFEDSE